MMNYIFSTDCVGAPYPADKLIQYTNGNGNQNQVEAYHPHIPLHPCLGRCTVLLPSPSSENNSWEEVNE